MKAVFLCAGYGTRLYPLTKDRPKALLSIAGEPLLNHLVRKLEPIAKIDQIILVSNGRFYSAFCDWRGRVQSTKKISVVNDGTMDNEHRLGATRDLKLALDEEQVRDDILVLASDNLFDSDLTSFVSFTEAKKAQAAVGVYDVHDRVLASQYGLVETDSESRVTRFLEKPKDPPTTLASMGIYYLSKWCARLIDRYVETGLRLDAPGFYMEWLSKQTDLFVFSFQGKWFDIGDLDSYQEADAYFARKR
ncbi:MAG: hypothetical protein A3G87_06515 [Omnitrophica bacterium RIFCSPLOWO2_12_FULL_50_11]|nr:MAG: hypothetical protein A3G87_06515 [Omnitrophica bacterium RIFCSPLOWO2_12_FULL_50_11]